MYQRVSIIHVTVLFGKIIFPLLSYSITPLKYSRYSYLQDAQIVHSDIHRAPFSLSYVSFYYCSKNIYHEIHLLNNDLSIKYNIINYRNNTVQQIFRVYSPRVTATEQPWSSPFPQSLAITILLFAALSLIILGTSYKWNHIVLSFYN